MTQNDELYKKLTPLNNKLHLTVKIRDTVNYSFTKKTNAVLLTCSEFEKASKIYPLLFVLDNKQMVPVVLFGLEKNQNLFLKWNHQWDAFYIPAYIRRYPFSLARKKNENSNDYIVCFDEKSPLVNKQAEHSLFQKNGKQTPYLTEKIHFLQEFQIEYEKTIQFVERLNKLDLLEPMSANVNLLNGESLSISSFYIINTKQFKNLSAEQYRELVISDDMKLIYEHFSSLDNFSTLIDKLAEKKLISKTVNKSKTTTKNTGKISKTKSRILDEAAE